MEDTVIRNTVVYLTYSIWDQGGRLFEQYDLPVGYMHGVNGPLFEKIEQALEGRKAGDKVEVMLAPEDGFGQHKPELTFTDDIENVPPQHRELGSEVMFANERGEQMLFRVTRIENGKLTVDANHPLAGQTVRFVVNIVGLRPATLDEIANGMPADGGGTGLRMH
ncbi:MAG: peptidylprolyl isomerase [Betaproteobacteria bacterium RIFCSPLOWO2_12_FULL_62_58]|nr:MAG: peptidylprolyl isomerase [Betaproteobacteria bacterium RIFCSPLOWO2_12_FULL_62_58]